MKNVFIITTGNNTGGYGHLVRCSALAFMLTKYYKCSFLLIDTPWENINQKFNVQHFQNQNAVKSFIKINAHKKDFVVIDSYSINKGFVIDMKQLEIHTVSINDLPDLALPTDLLINHAINISTNQYNLPETTQLLLGKKYLLLRNSFFKSFTPFPKTNKIFICFGGADPFGLSLKILKYLSPFYKKYRINLLTNSKLLRKSLSEFQKKNISVNLTVHSHIDAPQVAQLIHQSQLAIVPTSTVSLECMNVGVNMLTGYYVDNQKILSKNVQDLNLAVCIGDFLKLKASEFEEKFNLAINGNFIPRQNQFFNENPKLNILKAFKALEENNLKTHTN